MNASTTHLDPATDPEGSARAAGLRYVSDTKPGISRVREDQEFRYLDPHGEPVDDPKILEHIKALAIPPAWTSVWICPHPRGHIQATARDARGRKQYRYHPRWREVRDETKFERMMAFAPTLPAIRDRVERDLARPGLPREKVLATVVRLLERTLIRVGNEEYARQHGHYGLTTMRDRHVDVEGTTLRFHFTGKSGKRHSMGVRDRRLARIIGRLQDLPGQELFQYVAEDGEVRSVESADVNAYLREISGQDFTAKDFRTWAGTVLAARALQELEQFDTAAMAKKNVVRAIESVAERLGNTPSVCRKCYVHPVVIESYLDGMMLTGVQEQVEEELQAALSKLPPEEAAVLVLLHGRLQEELARRPRPAEGAR